MNEYPGRVNRNVETDMAEVCSVCGDDALFETDSHTCHRLACGHAFHVDCIVQWFAHGQSSCPNCRHDEVEEHMVRRSASSRIAAARRRATTPVHVRRLIRQYDDAQSRANTARVELRDHRAAHRDVFTSDRRLSTRLRHYTCRARMLRCHVGYMCISKVPLVDRYRLAPVPSEEDDEDE